MAGTVLKAAPHPSKVSGSSGPKLVVVMVGLPARGKSYISEKLARYLNWLQYSTQVFNAGKNRRAILLGTDCVDAGLPLDQRLEKEIGHPASFFDPNNSEALHQRDVIALGTLDQLLDWLLGKDGCVGVFDATNSTPQRRTTILDHIQNRGGSQLQVLFLESCCYDPQILEKNLHLKLSGPDYKDKESNKSLTDFRQRISEYEKSYVTLGDFEEAQEIAYLKLIDVGRKIIAYGINGLLPGLVVEYLLNFHLFDRCIWLARNGESSDDTFGRIGRHSPLSRKGRRFANALAKFIEERQSNPKTHHQARPQSVTPVTDRLCKGGVFGSGISGRPRTAMECEIWTSMMTQAIETSQPFRERGYEVKHLKALDDLNAGDMEGYTFAQIEETFPEEMAQRRKDPLKYRWPGPGGEGYADLLHRLRPLIIELERSRNDVVLITHRAIVRVLLAYFRNLGRENLAEIPVPMGKVFAVTPQPYGVVVETYTYDERTDRFNLDSHS